MWSMCEQQGVDAAAGLENSGGHCEDGGMLPCVKYPGMVEATPVSESGLPIMILHPFSISLTIAWPGDLSKC